MNNKETGNFGEDAASEFLVNNGFSIITRNFRYGKGEIDIIANDAEILVFIEVKFRKSDEYGSPLLAITKNKQNQIRKIALAYLTEKNITNTDCRFDVIGITLDKENKPVIEHIKNAF
jgi:putative endonuclease